MARKWSNQNLPGVLHFITGSLHRRRPVFTQDDCCLVLLDVCGSLKEEWPFKLVAYVLMPDHVHLIVNPRDGRIKELTGALKSLSARSIGGAAKGLDFTRARTEADGTRRQVWQESFKDLPLWSPWMIWQKINYIHANPVKAGLVGAAKDYRWSSFRAFYLNASEPLAVDHDWWWPDDVQKLKRAMQDVSRKGGGGKPPS
jgi:putative transposase